MAYAAYKRVQNRIATGTIPTAEDWAAVYAWRNPMTLAELLADSGGYAVDANAPASGEYVASDRIWTKDGYILDVAASGASDHDRTTAGGVKLYDIDFAPALIAARVTTAEGDITTLQGEMTTAQGDISTLQTTVSGIQAGSDGTGFHYPSALTSTAIQTAIDAAETASGGVVFLPAGTYNVTSTIILKDRVALRGAGVGKTILSLANGANCDVLRSVDQYHEFFEIRDLMIDGNRTQQGADNGTASTNYRGLVILGNASPGSQASNSVFNLTDPRGIIENVFVYDVRGDAVYLEQSRELYVNNLNTAFAGRRAIYQRTVDSNFSNCVFGPCEIGANIFHGASNRYTNVKSWGSGNGVDTSGDITTLWDAIATALDANDGSAGYGYSSSGGMADDRMKGCGLVVKDPKSTISGLQIQDTSGSGLWFAGGDTVISGVAIDRAGEIGDQFGIANVFSPSVKYGIRHNSGELILDGTSFGTSGRASRPDYAFSSVGSDRYDVRLLGEDTAYTVAQAQLTNANGAFNRQDVTALDARVTAAEGDITTLQGEMTTAQSDITSAEGDITALQGQMIDALSDIASHLSEIASLKSRVLQLEVGGAPTPLFTDTAGTLDSEWIGAVPQKGLVYCEFTAPDFASMSDREGLFTIRLTGGGGGHHGAAVSLEKNAGRFSFGVRDLSSNSSFEQGHGFHPGKLHKVWFSYDLDTGESSLMVDTGTVQYAAAHASYTGGVTSDRVSLWYQRFSGTAAGLSSGRGTISLYDAGDFS